MSLLHRGISIELRPVEVLLFFRLRLFRNGIISAGFRFGLFDLGGSGFRSGAVQFNTTRWSPIMHTSWTGSWVCDEGDSGKGVTFFAMVTPISRTEGSQVPGWRVDHGAQEPSLASVRNSGAFILPWFGGSAAV